MKKLTFLKTFKILKTGVASHKYWNFAKIGLGYS